MIADQAHSPVSVKRPASKSKPPEAKPRRPYGLIAGILAVGAAAYFGLHSKAASTAEAPAAPPPPKVTVATVEERTMIDRHELLGRVDAVESVEIRPRVSGHIDEVRLQSGQLVKKGDVLFVIDPRPYRAQFDLATASVERALAKAQNTNRIAKRSTELYKSRTISIEESDTSSSTDAEAQADLLAAEAALATAKLDLEFTEVRAPIDGRVSRALVTAGNLVSGAPSGATLLTTIVSVGEVYVYADVDEETLLAFNRLQRDGKLPTENGRVPVEMQLSDETAFGHRGYVESADNRLQMGTGSLVLRMVFPNPTGELIPGLFARVRLPVSAPHTALLVSERAVGTDQSQKFVLTVGADKVATYRAVKLGATVDGQRIIRDGLQPGDHVIVNGLQRARPGNPVTPELTKTNTIAAQ